MSSNNYQLYRTNVKLGGQMKWDLVLSTYSGELVVNDMHLVPISDLVSYDKKSHDDIIKYSHHENISSFYEKTKGSFYSECIDPAYSNDYPIISTDKTGGELNFMDTHDSTYEMGCKRSANFSVYGKQFEFLCPLWLEDFSCSDVLIFTVKGSYKNGRSVFKKELVLDKKNVDGLYHDSFVQYFNNYIKYISGQSGKIGDDLINIDFRNKEAWLSGLSVDGGVYNEAALHNVSSICSNLLYRERPLMEFDKIIIDSFENTHTIARQLFNICLCFNLSDMIHPNAYNKMIGNNIDISVDVSIVSGTEHSDLEKRDMYSNYDFIPKRKFKFIDMYENEETVESDKNVLSYLKDNQYLNFVNKNKYSQQIIHWSLCDSPNYIFNLYNGFAGYLTESDKTIEFTGLQDCTPNMMIAKYDKISNNIGWCNITDNFDYNKYQFTIYKNPQKYIDKGWLTDFAGKVMVNGVKYRSTCPESIPPIMLGYTKESIPDNTPIIYNDSEGTLYLFESVNSSAQYSDYMVFVSNNYDFLTFKGFKKCLYNYLINNEVSDKYYNRIKTLYDFLCGFISPSHIIFTRSLTTSSVDGPSKDITEIEYYKNDTKSIKGNLWRYVGRIRPFFISSDSIYYNNYYYKDYVDTSLKGGCGEYAQYCSSSYKPIYPSINYSSIVKNKVDYNQPFCLLSVSDNIKEWKWFNENRVIIIPDIINISLTGDGSNLKGDIIEYLQEKFNLTTTEASWIYDRYNYDISFEYKSLKEITEYIYTIKASLK